jgi:hypothetical protein
MDTSYVLVNWGAMGTQPQATWIVPTSLQENNAPIAVPNAPNVYVVANNSLVHILTGSKRACVHLGSARTY